MNYFTPDDITIAKSTIWLILNFIEQIVMVTYVYLMRINEVKQKIQFELFTFLVSWFVYSNVMAFFDYRVLTHKPITNSDIIQLAFSMFILYICLFLNGYFPVILSYCYHTSISYHFSPQLMNNLYEIITEHIEELAYENGASIYLTDKNELYIDLNDSEQVFVLNVKEEK